MPTMNDKQWLQINREAARLERFAKDKKQATPEGRMVMKERYKFIMQEVDLACNNFIRRYNAPNLDGEKPRFQFMDVCCCPGGFSEYFLLTVPHARGVGLSLPVEEGGHILADNTMNRKTGGHEPSVLVKDKRRYTIYFQDVTTIASSLTAADFWQPGVNALNGVDKTTPAETAEPHMRNNFTHMILDGSFLGGKANIYMETIYGSDAENPAFNVYASHVAGHQALLAAQLAIMAANLQDGGQVVLRMSMTWSHFTNGVLALLRRIFRGSVQNYKPRSCHQDKISYYLVCQDFDLAVARQLKVGPRFAEMTARFRSGAWGRPDTLIPFPELPEGRNVQELYHLWGNALQVYYLPVWLFRKLVEEAMSQRMLPLQFTKHSPCWKHLTFGDQPGEGCRLGSACQLAHSKLELHPYTKVAFSQVNGHLYKPAFVNPLDPRFGMLRPGEGHPRNEQKEVERQISEWVLCAHGEATLPGVSNPAICANSLMHQTCVTLLTLKLSLPMAEQIWHHMLLWMHTAFLSNFSKSGVRHASDPLALTHFNSKFNTRSVAHVLAGPDAQPLPMHAPLVPPLGIQPPVMHAHAGDVFGVGAHGSMSMGVQGSMQGAMGPEMDLGGLGMAGLEGGIQGDGDTVIEGGYHAGDDEGVMDTFGTEVFDGTEKDIGAMKLSGYSMPLVDVQVADEYSHTALLQYLGE